MKSMNLIASFALLSCCVLMPPTEAMAARRKTDTPLNLDFTKGDKPGKEHGHILGPTGLRGWISGVRKEGTGHARQIYVMEVAPNSPGANLFQKGDVILGVNKQNFSSDARIAFARAITEAEKTENQGVLNVRRWRKGRTEDVVLKLPVMGSYGPKTVKSEKITRLTEMAIKSITENGIGMLGIPAHVNALALLATGDKQHLPLVKAHVSKIKQPKTEKLCVWHNAYACLLLTEYYLATKDESALPKVREFALSLANGQNLVGNWGHSYAKPNGILPGYGAMSQAALTAGMALALADKCGINEPKVTQAAKKTLDFFRWYTGKGSVPYGDHRPGGEGHCSNGKNAGCAVMMNIMEDKEGAAFFGRMATVATANERESGHTGHFFNTLWGPLGANVIGPDALAVQLAELSWLFDLERTLSGASVYNPQPGSFGGINHKYGGWDCTGARLLAYVADRRCIYITGKETCVTPVTGKELEKVVAVREMDIDGMSEAKLLTLLSSWSPAIRNSAAARLAEGKVDQKVLLGMLNGKSVVTRSGACQTLAALGNTMSDQAVAELIRLLEDEDLGVRRYSVIALGTSENAKGVPALLQAALHKDLKNDPRERLLREISMALFTHKSLKNNPSYMRDAKEHLDNADRKLLIPALRRMLMGAGGHARLATMMFCKDLPWEDLEPLLPELLHNAAYKAPGCVMFGSGAQHRALELLSKHGVRQVLDESMISFLLETQGSGGQHYAQAVGLEALTLFGSDAREFLPMLEEFRTKIRGEPERWEVHKVIPPLIDKTEKALKQDKGHPALRKIEPRIAVPGLDKVFGVPEQEKP